MMTNGDFHEIIEKLIESADFFNKHDMNKKSVIYALIEKMYNESMEIANEGRKLVLDPIAYDKNILPSYSWIKEWLDENNAEMVESKSE